MMSRTSTPKKYKIGNEEMTLSEFSRKYGLKPQTIKARYELQWDHSEIFLPVGVKRQKNKISRGITPWTKSSYECYLNGCRCSTCQIVPEFFKAECHMKQAVFELVKNYGVPENKRKEIIC